MSAAVCPVRFCGGTLEHDVDRAFGRVVARCPRCERRTAGVCRDCPAPVEGAIGRALRCAVCKVKARRTADARQRAAPDYPRKARAKWKKRRDAMTPEALAERVRRLKQWVVDNPDRVKKARRRAALNPTPKQRAAERRWNRSPTRAQAKREQARAKYYAEHPVRPAPRCAGCDVEIPYNGVGTKGRCGAPPKWCDACCSPAELRRRLNRRAAQLLLAREEPAA